MYPLIMKQECLYNNVFANHTPPPKKKRHILKGLGEIQEPMGTK